MRIRFLGFAALGALAIASCDTSQQLGPEPTLEEEEALAADLVRESGESIDSHRDGAEPLVVRLIHGILASGNERAIAMLHRARASRAAAQDEEDPEVRRQLLHEAHGLLLGAILQVYPNAPNRIGAVVDQALQRIHARLGDREAPRIRLILGRVRHLRERAESTDRPMARLHFNLTAAHVLHRLVHHVRHGTDDAVTASQAAALASLNQ